MVFPLQIAPYYNHKNTKQMKTQSKDILIHCALCLVTVALLALLAFGASLLQ